jgi:hypothetical protein
MNPHLETSNPGSMKEVPETSVGAMFDRAVSEQAKQVASLFFFENLDSLFFFESLSAFL